MTIITNILTIAFFTACILFVGTVTFERIVKIKRNRRKSELESLVRGDYIEINHPSYDKKAIFKYLVEYDSMAVTTLKNGVMDGMYVISSNHFIKKIE